MNSRSEEPRSASVRGPDPPPSLTYGAAVAGELGARLVWAIEAAFGALVVGRTLWLWRFYLLVAHREGSDSAT